MTEKQQELYTRTKARLRRLGKENPADVIVALAEEIDRYREKIHSMEEFIAKRERKRGNETALVAELRNKPSRDNRDLLDRAADKIEELEADLGKQSEWISVDERLPHSQQMVIGFTPCDGYMFIGFYQKVESPYYKSYWNIITSMRSTRKMTKKVTHWMPLPEAPKMKGGE